MYDQQPHFVDGGSVLLQCIFKHIVFATKGSWAFVMKSITTFSVKGRFMGACVGEKEETKTKKGGQKTLVRKEVSRMSQKSGCIERRLVSNI